MLTKWIEKIISKTKNNSTRYRCSIKNWMMGLCDDIKCGYDLSEHHTKSNHDSVQCPECGKWQQKCIIIFDQEEYDQWEYDARKN